VTFYPVTGNYGGGRKCLPRPSDDEAIGRMCAWLKKNRMVGQTTLAGKLTLTLRDEAYTKMLLDACGTQQLPHGL